MNKNVLKSLLIALLMLAPAFRDNSEMQGQYVYAVFGTVTEKDNLDEYGNEVPLAGVSVVVKGTTFGTNTDLFGYYILPGNFYGHKLEFRYVGFKDYEADVTSPYQQIDISMEPDDDPS